MCDYWRGVVHGDLGQSLRLHDSVMQLIVQRYPYTLALTLAALLIGVGLSVPAGCDFGAASEWVAGPGAWVVESWWGCRFRILRWGRF